MNNNFTIASNEYFNAGGHCMVDITTVYDKQQKRMLYVYVSDDCMTVASYDYVRSDLIDGLDAVDCELYVVDCAEWTTMPDPLNHTMNNMPVEIVELLMHCLTSFIRNKAKYDKQHSFIALEQLPNELYVLVDAEYLMYIAENDLLVETDGYKIIGQDKWLEKHQTIFVESNDQTDEEELYDCNGLTAIRLQKEMDALLPPNNDDDDDWQEFYNSKVQLIVNDQLYTFMNSAAVYQALDMFAQSIIDEQ